jgi:hypothetical protein
LIDGCLPTCSYIPSVKRFASDWRDSLLGFLIAGGLRLLVLAGLMA